MAKKITRRDFIKIGVGATAVTTGFTPLVRQIVAEPFVKPPEEALPGRAIWYASTCRQCSAGCGILVRVINGRAKKIEGNPLHPLNRGKLCARGQAGLQVLYHPDRLRNAVQQTGGRGSRQFEPLHWENALQQALEKIRQAGPEGVAFLGGRMPDHLYFLVSRWLKAQGANPPVIHDLLSTLEGQATSIQVAETLFGSTRLPRYDLANADVLFSFGANFLETWCSPVAYSQAFGYFRQGQAKGRGYFVQFEPRLSATAASADEWIPVRPGTEGLVALALGRIIIEQQLGHVGAFDKEEASLFQNVNVNQIAELSDISPDKLSHLANILAAADKPLAIPGGYPAGHTNGYDAYRAIFALNLILKRLGQRGGVFLSPPSPTEQLPASPPPNTFSDLQVLIDKMHLGQVKVLMIYGCNPVFELPKSSGFLKALSKVPFVISFNSFVDETGLQSDLVLPDHSYLESWGYQVVTPGADRPALSSQQPVVRPLYDTRSTADVILQMASMMGGQVAEELPWASEQLFLEDASGVLYDLSITAYGAKTSGDFWAKWRQYGGWWSKREILLEPEPVGFEESPLPASQPEFAGDAATYPYILYPYPHIGWSDGRGANLPWLQELPDPMTTASWQTWVEISPELAHQLGVEDNDVVIVRSPHGELEAPVVVYPGLRPEVIAIPIGQGHLEYGRFAQNRGSNPIQLLAPLQDAVTGSLSWGATRIQIEPTGQMYKLARLENLDGEGRESIR